MVKMPGSCPICRGRLNVKSLYCPGCKVKIEGDFELPGILSLSPEQMDFVGVFLRARGNIKVVERELGISYPTVKNRLEDVVAALGLGETRPIDERPSVDASELLDSLGRGETSVEDVLKKLQGET
jgi:hypothetical protein